MGNLGGVPLEPGTILAGRYRIERVLGVGGTGVVIGATDVSLEKKVAIKVLRAALASDEIRLRFDREARAIAKIESEHVVVVLDAGSLPDGTPFMVMEHLEGRDLAKVLKEDGSLSIPTSVDCMLQVCEALAQAHACGIIHRDLKPANLFLSVLPDGAPHVRVVDFGISKILDKALVNDGGGAEVTGMSATLGSPRYMAPEQLRNSKEVDVRADLWSVGVVLFQLITGKHAFVGETNVQATRKILHGEPLVLDAVVPDAPAALSKVVSRCLEKDPAARYQTAEELAAALWPFASERARAALERQREARQAKKAKLARELPTAPRSFVPYRPPHAGRQQARTRLAIAGGGLLAVLLLSAVVAVAKLAGPGGGGGGAGAGGASDALRRNTVPLDAAAPPP